MINVTGSARRTCAPTSSCGARLFRRRARRCWRRSSACSRSRPGRGRFLGPAADGVQGRARADPRDHGEAARRAGRHREHRARRLPPDQSVEVRSGDVGACRARERLGRAAAAGGRVRLGRFEFIYQGRRREGRDDGRGDADARLRAEQIAGQGGRSIQGLRNARMGVVQINPLYSAATSWEGNNDTSSLDKTITATVARPSRSGDPARVAGGTRLRRLQVQLGRRQKPGAPAAGRRLQRIPVDRLEIRNTTSSSVISCT